MNDIPSILINSKNLKEADRKITKIKKEELKNYIKANKKEPNIKIKKIKDLFENILKQM